MNCHDLNSSKGTLQLDHVCPPSKGGKKKVLVVLFLFFPSIGKVRSPPKARIPAFAKKKKNKINIKLLWNSLCRSL